MNFQEINQISSYIFQKGTIVFQIPQKDQSLKQNLPIQVITSKGLPVNIDFESKNFWLFFSKEPEISLYIPKIKEFGIVDIQITEDYEAKTTSLWQGPHDFNNEFNIQLNSRYESFIKLFINGNLIKQFKVKR